MFKHLRLLPLAAAVAVAAACAPDSSTGPYDVSLDRAAIANDGNQGGNKFLTVMTRNLYLGSSLSPVMAAPTPGHVPIGVAQMWANIHATNFPARAKALADEIAAAQPELIGLQEVTLWRTQFPGDQYPGGAATPATTIEFDFLALLLSELEARGLKYTVAALSDNFDAELFMFTGTPGASPVRDVRMTDRDVILAKHNFKTWNSRDGIYNARLPLPIGGTGPVVQIIRGWTSVDAKFRGEEFRFFNTHLEVESPAPFAYIQTLQGQEAIAMLAASPLPVIAVGDFNSPATGLVTPTYGMLLAAGLTDAWNETNPGVDGYSAGMSGDLLGPVSLFSSRIDLVLFRGPMAAISAELVGEEESDRLPSRLMPSDHAGVVATIRLGLVQ